MRSVSGPVYRGIAFREESEMIYVSSACVRRDTIKESVEELAQSGFKSIELSGGTEYYQGYQESLLELKNKYNLNYLLHNYFPPSNQI